MTWFRACAYVRWLRLFCAGIGVGDPFSSSFLIYVKHTADTPYSYPRQKRHCPIAGAPCFLLSLVLFWGLYGGTWLTPPSQTCDYMGARDDLSFGPRTFTHVTRRARCLHGHGAYFCAPYPRRLLARYFLQLLRALTSNSSQVTPYEQAPYSIHAADCIHCTSLCSAAIFFFVVCGPSCLLTYVQFLSLLTL